MEVGNLACLAFGLMVFWFIFLNILLIRSVNPYFMSIKRLIEWIFR
jgi:hypothetical protein